MYEVKEAVEQLAEGLKSRDAKIKEFADETRSRLLNLEQGAARRPLGDNSAKSAGEIVVASAEYKAVGRGNTMQPTHVGSFHKAAITNATGQSQPLVAADRRGIVGAADQQTLSIRSLFSPAGTSSNLVEFPREISDDTDVQAAPQYSSGSYENVAKHEISMAFELASVPVITVAAWVPASKQILSDAPLLASYIDGRLTYGVKLREEDEVLNGDGTNGSLLGLIAQAAAYSGAETGDHAVDTLIKAVAQVNAVGAYTATGCVLNPTDVTALLLLKDGQGRYLFESVAAIEAKLGVRIASSKQMAGGSFLVGDFIRGAGLFDREEATVRIAEQHSDFFVKNMVAILGEERIALAVYSELAFVEGAL